jgi:hypothetical protein
MNVPQDGFTQRFRIKPFSGKQISGHSGSLDARPRGIEDTRQPTSIAHGLWKRTQVKYLIALSLLGFS